jgi:hypothetical protein
MGPIPALNQQLSMKEQAIQELKILYTYQNKVLQKDKIIFNKDISIHVKGRTAHIHQWINTNQSVILKSAKEAKINSLLHVCPINTYFQLRRDQN